MTRLERIAVANRAASAMRSQVPRKVKTYDPATGKTTGEVTTLAVQKSALKRHGIEFDAEGTAECVACKRKYDPPKKKSADRLCRRCLRAARSVDLQELRERARKVGEAKGIPDLDSWVSKIVDAKRRGAKWDIEDRAREI